MCSLGFQPVGLPKTESLPDSNKNKSHIIPLIVATTRSWQIAQRVTTGAFLQSDMGYIVLQKSLYWRAIQPLLQANIGSFGKQGGI